MELKHLDSKVYQQVRFLLFISFGIISFFQLIFQPLKIPDDALKLQSNFKLILMGASGQGKTEWILSLLQHRSKAIIDDFKEVIYCIPNNCGHLPSVKRTIEKIKETCDNITVTIYEGLLTNLEGVYRPNDETDHCLIVYDDMFTDIINSRAFSHFATFGSRHHNTSLIVTSQNIYETGRYALTVRRQFSYYCIFYPAAEKSILITLGKNLFPTNPSCLINCFNKLIPHTSNPYEQYILVDVDSKSKLPYGMRLRSNFFSSTPYFFITDEK